MWNKGFEGWYFKHQLEDDTIALIPGRAASGAFVQLISAAGSRQFDVPALSVDAGVIKAGKCVFSAHGCTVDLPGVSGELAYGPPTPLRADIMGPFRFFPMECRHGVISMGHTLRGSLTIDGTPHRFSGGNGYIEKDSGTSFPRSYLWLQCNDFAAPCSVMVSIACIPFCGMHFTGCICAMIYAGHEYRLATYTGVRIHAASASHICLSQGRLLLKIDITPSQDGHPLRAPVRGSMSGVIRESSNASIFLQLWDNGKQVAALRSDHASFEYVPAAPRSKGAKKP
ncbi:MAG: tocopherol cyclase family protein [Oscillospiraceae bacterium]|nr:tocopherol cyclase family protein [Oscillospiraceae bacterium]